MIWSRHIVQRIAFYSSQQYYLNIYYKSISLAWVLCLLLPSHLSCLSHRKTQCSRLKPSYEFHFEGLSNFSFSVEELVQMQDVNPSISKWNTKLILNLCMNYMVHVSCTMLRIKNHPCNCTSYSDNALHLLVLVAGKSYWGLQVTCSFSNWGERYIVKGQIMFEGHWRLQSWTLGEVSERPQTLASQRPTVWALQDGCQAQPPLQKQRQRESPSPRAFITWRMLFLHNSSPFQSNPVHTIPIPCTILTQSPVSESYIEVDCLKLQMQRLSLRNNWLEFQTPGKFTLHFRRI